MPPSSRSDGMAGTLPQLEALAGVMNTSGSGVLASLRLLLSVEQIDESAWGLLLALVKDAELSTLTALIEPLYAAQRMQRQLVQQRFEEWVLFLFREARENTLKEDRHAH